MKLPFPFLAGVKSEWTYLLLIGVGCLTWDPFLQMGNLFLVLLFFQKENTNKGMTTSLQNIDPSKLKFGEAKTVKADHGEFKLIALSYNGGKKLSVLMPKCFLWGLQKDI